MNEIDRRRVRLRCLRSIFYDEVAYIKELTSLTEHFLKEEYQSIIDRADKEITKDLPEFENRFIAECYAEDVDKIQEVFPRILRYSLFVTSMTKLECAIVSLCKGTKHIFGLSDDFSPKPPYVISRGLEYLKDQLGINTEKFRHYIELMEKYRMVRNCIVHSEGDITERDKDEPLLRQFIAESPTLDIDRHNRIILLEGFVTGAAHTSDLLWERLLNAIKEKIDVQQHRGDRE